MKVGFYVYSISVAGVVRYIGKGRGYRWKVHTRSPAAIDQTRRARGLRKAQVDGVEVVIEKLADGLTEDEAFAREREWIAKLGRHQLWNLTDGGEGISGYQHTPEGRAQRRASMLGKNRGPRSAEVISKISANRKGIKLSPEHIEQIRMRLTGRELSVELRAKISASGIGKHTHRHSDEAKARISAAQIGRPRSPETIEKIRSANFGQKRSPETCAKMSAAAMGRKLSPEHAEKLLAATRGRALVDTHRAKISAALAGKSRGPMSDEHRAKIRAGVIARIGERGRETPLSKPIA